MVEIYPVVKVSNLEQMGIIDFSFNPLNGYIISGLASWDMESFYGSPDLTKYATITVYALPTDSIELKAPVFTPLRFDNSFYYVSSGGGYRHAYIGTFKIPHTPVMPKGSGQLIMVWKTNKTNILYANNVETTRSNPVWSVQDYTEYVGGGSIGTTIVSFDFGTSDYRDIIACGDVRTRDANYVSSMVIEISDDDTNWIRINYLENLSTSYKSWYAIDTNIKFRYVRVRVTSWYVENPGYGRLRKFIVFS